MMLLFIQDSDHMNKLGNKTMSRADYPQLYRAADCLSITYQKVYFGLLGGYLVTLIVGSIVSMCGNGVVANSIALGLFILSLAIFAISKIWDPIKLWYNGRAVAESVKSMTWKWMMQAEPYPYEIPGTASKNLQNDLQQLLEQNRTLFNHYQDDDDGFYSISDKMREVRDATTREKLDFYNKNRVNDQLRWYKRKSKTLRIAYIAYSVAVVLCYIAIIILMIISISKPTIIFPVELISAISAALISWIEAKKYNELSCAYSLAVNDISIIKDNMLEGQVGSQEVSEYVNNSENAFSREHTQWIARKQ